MVTDSGFPSETRGRRLLRRAAGREPWGGLDIWPSRYGWTHYRLTLHPPGADVRERIQLQVWRALPLIAAGLALVVLCAAGCVVDLAAAIGLAVAAAVAVTAAVAWRTRRVRPLLVSRHGGTEDLGDRLLPVGDMELITHWWDALTTADAALRAGTISVADHELVWAAAWESLRRTPARRMRGTPMDRAEKDRRIRTFGTPSGR